MPRSARVFLSPLAAVATLAIGLAFVGAVRTLTAAIFSPSSVAPRNKDWSKETIAIATIEKPFEQEAVSGPPKLSCYDLNILPIWHELKRDEQFKEWGGYSGDVIDCSELVEITKIDLNRDTTAEFLVRGKFVLCGGTGNCAFWVFRLDGNKAKKLLGASDYVEIYGLENPVQKTRNRGYADLLLRDHASASETAYRTYKFDGEKYVESRCMYEVPKYGRDGEGAWELIPCEQRDH